MKGDGEFSQRVRLPAVQVATLGRDELALALAYEVEPFSRVPASDADVVWTEVADPDGSVRVYDVTVRPRRSSRRAGGGGAAAGARWLLPAAVLAVLAVLGLVADFAVTKRRIAVLNDELAARVPLDAQVKRIRREAKDTEEESQRTSRARLASAAAQGRVAALRGAHAGLMSALANVCGGRTVVRSLASDAASGDVELVAVAASPEEAARVLADLTLAVSGCGWRLVPGGMESGADGSFTGFSCRLYYINENTPLRDVGDL